MFNKSPIFITAKRITLVVIGSIIMAFNINTFVHAGGLIPGGFTGLTLLLQEISSTYFGIAIPYSVIVYTLNAIPAIVCFKFIGKKFALYSCLMIVLSGLFVDWMPYMFVEELQGSNTLLSSIFGGILVTIGTMFALYADATGGGTDFIAVYYSEKYNRDAWNYIFAGNCVILTIAGILFGLDKALYSIISQFATTVSLNALYRVYQQQTMFIITAKPDEVYQLIYKTTNHGATAFRGVGLYKKDERVLLYSVVYANEVAKLITEIRKIDSTAFINVIKTEQLNGQFFKRAKD